MGKMFGAVTIVICVCIAPFIAQADGLYTLMRTIMAVINVPILTVILVGIVSKRTPALAAYIALPVGMVSFYIAHFVLKGDFGIVQIHWLHLVGLNFLWMVSIMMTVRYLKPMSKPYEQVYTNQVEVKPWKYAVHASWMIVGLLALLYTVFSGIGILGEQGSAGKVIAALSLVAVLCFVIHRLLNRHSSKQSTTVGVAKEV
ncbi:hypothetical protein NHN17_23785 [Photobacterium sp. ZSDE20]|uniref:Uncharacterized protein n=1 Tax=Photobacterium pectinilyticum TaxID=2906793 RepID=A0ABT1NB50_9GAMM|nr:hypothetical protein [Photobacterium sp. ZSDE20]MCQ1061064.1 hypothetical protein [Photobacterium sp. ZSDE20]